MDGAAAVKAKHLGDYCFGWEMGGGLNLKRKMLGLQDLIAVNDEHIHGI
jgi:hypothetical protein